MIMRQDLIPQIDKRASKYIIITKPILDIIFLLGDAGSPGGKKEDGDNTDMIR